MIVCLFFKYCVLLRLDLFLSFQFMINFVLFSFLINLLPSVRGHAADIKCVPMSNLASFTF